MQANTENMMKQQLVQEMCKLLMQVWNEENLQYEQRKMKYPISTRMILYIRFELDISMLIRLYNTMLYQDQMQLC